MDIEPLVGMLRGAAVLHGPTHTYLGAVPIALATAGLAPWLCRPLLRRWNREVQHHRVAWLHENELWGHAQCCSAPWQAPARMWCSTA